MVYNAGDRLAVGGYRSIEAAQLLCSLCYALLRVMPSFDVLSFRGLHGMGLPLVLPGGSCYDGSKA